MKEKITKHINELFRDAPKTRRAVELKEEMTQNTIEKYEDLIGEGCQEEDAFRIVVDSIGDVTELFEDLKDRSLFLLPEEQRRKRAVLKAAAVGIYIFAGVVFIISMVVSEMYYALAPEGGILGLALTALICIPPTTKRRRTWWSCTRRPPTPAAGRGRSGLLSACSSGW